MSKSKRALLFAYHFPPSQAAGAQRWESLVKLGVERGWTFDVIYAGSAASIPDMEGVRRFPVQPKEHWSLRWRRSLVRMRHALQRRSANSVAEPQAVATQSLSPVVPVDELPRLFSRAGLRATVNAVFFYLADLPWVMSAAREGSRLAEREQYASIICSSPPHLATQAAARVARRYGIPLILDFRDPWSAMEIVQRDFASQTFVKLSRVLERRAMQQAALVVMNTNEALRATQMRYPAVPMVVVRNGSRQKCRANPGARDRFEMLYAGAIYLDRDPRPLLDGIRHFVESALIPSTDFRMRFVGDVATYGGVSLQQLAAERGIGQYVDISMQVDKQTLTGIQATASVLVNLPQGARLCIPSKLYEYFEHPSWILALETPGSASYNLLAQTRASVASPNDPAAIGRAIGDLYHRFAAGERPESIATQIDMGIATQATILYDAVDRVCA